MALTLKILGIGNIADTQEKTLVPGSANKGSLVQTVSLTNKDTANITVSGIFVKVATGVSTTTRRLVSPQNFTIAPNAQFVITTDITLGSTLIANGFSGVSILDTLVAQVASGAPNIDYVVCGMERDV
jgi:hypothetical protein